MRLIIYPLVGLILATTYFIPPMQAMFADDSNFDAYRMIALNVILARTLIEGLASRGRWTKMTKQLDQALDVERELTRQQAQSIEAGQDSARLQEKLQAADDRTASLEAEVAAVRGEAEKLQIALDDFRQRSQDMQKKLTSASGSGDEAINLLALLQQKGRFIDFAMEDITSIDDSQVGAAARVVHQGCRQVLKELFNIQPLQSDGEGRKIVISGEADLRDYRLVGRVKDEPPYEGTLLHRGWQTDRIDMPQSTAHRRQSGSRIIAPAEIELS